MNVDNREPALPAIKKTGVRRGLVAGIVLANAFMAGVIGYALDQSRSQHVEQAQVTVDNLSRILEENLASTFDKIDDTLVTISDEVASQKAAGRVNSQALKAFITQRHARLPEALSLRLFNAAGDIDLAATGDNEPVNIADRAYFRKLRDDPAAGLVVSQPLVGRLSKIWRIAFARRLNEPDGSFGGVVSGTVSVVRLNNAFSVINLGPHGNVALWGSGPTLIARYPDLVNSASPIGSGAIAKELRTLIENDAKAVPTHTRSALDGVERTYFFRKVGNYPLYLVFGLADEDYLAAWHVQCRQMIGLAALFALSSLLTYFFVHRNWTARLAAIEALEQQEAKLEFLANHDPLTGLPNRVVGRDHMELAMAGANRERSKAALMFVDLDRFKTINDSLGHSIGDELLKQVTTRLRNCVRETDTISRQGGDEFLIILDNIHDTDAAARVSDALAQALAHPFHIAGHELFISASIGIAIYPDDGGDFDTLLKCADTAMYSAKDAGRNGYRFFSEQMNVDAVETLRLRNELNWGLARDEFVLHYQPQIDLASGRVCGVEALIRWNHPKLGLILPGRFITQAEESGLIVPMGAWVIETACHQMAAWQRAGLGKFSIAVNLSAVEFRRGDLLENVERALAASGLDPQWLDLELTESILIEDTENVLQTARRLKGLGVTLSIDDFGTGYSSLAYLRRFAVDKLKIDQTFVRDISANPDDDAIVRAIVHMARSLGLRTVAEGVEAEQAIAPLVRLGCDEAQGYLFARPMPVAEVEDFLRARAQPTDGSEKLPLDVQPSAAFSS